MNRRCTATNRIARDMADANEPPPISKLTRTKQRWAREGRLINGKPLHPEEQRLPPGQHLTRDWPTLDLGVMAQRCGAGGPAIRTARSKLRFSGISRNSPH